MMPVLSGVIAVVAIVTAVWLLKGGARLVHRGSRTLRGGLSRAFTRHPSGAQAAEASDRDWIYGVRGAREARTGGASSDTVQATEAAVTIGSSSAGKPEPHEPDGTPTVTLPSREDARNPAEEKKKHAELAASAIVQEAEERGAGILAEAESKAAQILAEAESKAAQILAEAESKAGEIPAETESKAGEILAEAESKAGEILAEAEAVKARAEQEIARERAQVTEERARLSAFLSNVLEAVQRSRVDQANVRELSELRELRELRGGATERE